IRGEIKIIVKVDFFIDANKFRQSSCGVQFFTTPSIPSCYKTVAFYGFVEELVVNDDPEYQWIDNFRTPRSSNEARQGLFQKLSGELQRKIGLKVLDLGGNAVIGYQQYFDLEGESGIVVRGIGTCVFLRKIYATSSPSTPTSFVASPRDDTGAPELLSADPSKSFPPNVQRKRRTSSTDSDGSSPMKDCSGSGEKGSLGTSLGNSRMPRHTMARQRTIDEFILLGVKQELAEIGRNDVISNWFSWLGEQSRGNSANPSFGDIRYAGTVGSWFADALEKEIDYNQLGFQPKVNKKATWVLGI
ncbi:C2 domain-containing 5-like, partial [Paramuricea clavata]